MVKIVGEAESIYIFEESSNEKDWTITGYRLTEEAAENYFNKYKMNSNARFTRCTRFKRNITIFAHVGLMNL